MAQTHDTTRFNEVLQEISESGNPLLTMLRMICQEFMELEVSQKISAERSERSEGRCGYRSGYRDRRLDTRLGTLNLSIPKLRNGGYVPVFMERWQRSEQALVATIHDIYVMGVSTRKVKALAESMGIESISAAEVSNISIENDAHETSRTAAGRQRHSHSLRLNTFCIIYVHLNPGGDSDSLWYSYSPAYTAFGYQNVITVITGGRIAMKNDWFPHVHNTLGRTFFQSFIGSIIGSYRFTKADPIFRDRCSLLFRGLFISIQHCKILLLLKKGQL